MHAKECEQVEKTFQFAGTLFPVGIGGSPDQKAIKNAITLCKIRISLEMLVPSRWEDRTQRERCASQAGS